MGMTSTSNTPNGGQSVDDDVTIIRTGMEEVLEVGVEPDDDFLDLGGDSLLAAQLAFLLSERLDRVVRARDVLRSRTATRLAEFVREQPTPAERA